MKPIQIKSGFPIVWGDLAFQNRWLRVIVMAALAVATISTATSAVLLRRKPVIVTLDQCGSVSLPGEPAPIEVEVEKAVRRYVDLRYSWKPENQAAILNSAKDFVAPQSLKAFEKTASELVTFSKGKNVSQRVYVTSTAVDAKASRIQVAADRFTEIQGLKAATALRVTLTYQTGPRTYENPWGIYVVKEEEVQ